ncbi:MAG: ATP-dependent Clp protease ATP-binding subunit [Clostridia bacterium]|nr:ATP-dependent Clp protease ATP-binding subunit [Clostridia bacterium]
MNQPICSRCKKNIAVVFITKLENGENRGSEGLCLRCAKELGIKPISDMMDRFGITPEDVEKMTAELAEQGDGDLMAGLMNSMGSMGFPMDGMGMALPQNSDEQDEEDRDGVEDDIEPSRAPSFPLFGNFFGKKSENQAKKEEKGEEKKNRKGPKFLPKFALNLTERARDGKLDRVIGRESETERVIQILNRRQKNNPCLIGEPGVGKTAVAEGLAQRIAEGNVPFKLRNKQVWLLDMTAMVAGTQFRGQFEGRMKSLIDEVKAMGNVILVIDEVHNLVGAGDAEGSMNAANILKPALSRGEIQVIGATTFKEYRKHIEKDTALERRFQPVTINEPSLDETFDILRGVKGYYESFHGVEVPDEVIRQAVYLADRYINDRFMPDKAIDLLDEACSDLNLKSAVINDRAAAKEQLKKLVHERETLMSADAGELSDEQLDQRYAKIAEMRSEELKLEGKLQELEEMPSPVLSIDDLSRVIELWTAIPASKVREQDFERLTKLEERLKRRVVGQDEAIEAVSSAIRRRRAGIGNKLKPVSFIFVGPTGVGKTELVKCLAADLFASEDALIRLDMSEYMEKHSVSKLIGAPPGYVGYDEAGQLTEKIRRRPYSVVLFDEIEKAHPDVLNILLQILDDGRVTDAQGRKVSFENTVIIMTSNAGSNRTSGTVGFGQTVTQQGREKALNALSEIMRPEFLNRIDEIVPFNHLSEENFRGIALIMLGDLKKGLDRNGMSFEWDDKAVDYLVKKSNSVKFGARNKRRLIEKEVEDKAATLVISSWDHPITSISLSSDGEQTIVEGR